MLKNLKFCNLLWIKIFQSQSNCEIAPCCCLGAVHPLSFMGKLSKDRRRAKEDGYRARSAYKLLHLDDQFHIFDSLKFSGDGFRAVDLCAAPGSWSQVLYRRLTTAYENALEKGENVSSPVIVSVDIQEMAPIKGVIQIQGDITAEEIVPRILSEFQGSRVHLVLCDGAPDVTGMHDIDEYVQSQIIFASLRLAILLLVPGATFVAKMFRGENSSLTYSQLYVFFDEVYCGKPASSRSSSFESFVVCKHFRCPLQIRCLSQLRSIGSFEESPEVNSNNNETQSDWFRRAMVPFVACGDLQGFDSDTTFFLNDNHQFKKPTQPPINPPYRHAVAVKRCSQE